MKKIYLVFSIIVAVLTFFAATNVGAACDPTLPLGWCFEYHGYRVEIVKPDGTPIPPDGTFPVNVSGDSVFTYKITKTASAKSISHIDILIPVCTPDPLPTPTNPLCNSVPCSGTLYVAGSGESSTGFGLGLTLQRAYKWICSSTGNLSFTLTGKVFASPNPMLVKVGSSTSDFAYGQILAPACGLIPTVVYPPQVPKTTKREVNILGIDVCILSADQSGCPTSLEDVYSCKAPLAVGASVCDDCAPTDRKFWNKGTIKDLGIVPGKLRQAWTDRDSRCPKTHWTDETSSCRQGMLDPYGNIYYVDLPAISGHVSKYLNGTGNLSGVTMRVSPGNTSLRTNIQGNYTICLGTTPWSGTVTPSKTGYIFTPTVYTSVGELTNENYTPTVVP